MPKKPKKHSISELTQLFKTGYEIDTPLFREHRTNAMLFNGNHYGKKTQQFDRQYRQQRGKYDTQAIRITENHLNKIISMRASALKALVPDVTVRPKNFGEFGDQKRAELHKSILEDWKHQSGFKEEEVRMIKEWMIYGELAVKVFWDEGEGRRLPDLYVTELEAEFDKIDEEGIEGVEVQIDADNIKTKKITRFEGRVTAEVIYPFDLIRDPCAESFKKAQWVCVKKLVDPDFLKRHFKQDDPRYKAVTEKSTDKYNTFRVNGEYTKTENKTLIKEFFFKPSYRYPNGYYYIVAGAESDTILWEGELPGGIFPIEILGYDEISTSPRHSSLIRHLRSNQLQVNLLKSKSVQTILSSGMDRVFINKGSKLSKPLKGSDGISVYEYTGTPPITEQGRVGEQFINVINMNIDQMYQKGNVQEAFEQQNKQVDAHTALFQSARQKATYNDYVCKYENFLKNVYMKVLKLTKMYMKDEALVYIAGSDEQVNIPEYKTMDDLGFEIAAEQQSMDAESKLGRALDIQKVLQYGANFDGAQLAALVKHMPYLNNEAVLETFPGYVDYQNALNDICRIDRGDQSVLNIRRYENHDYMIQALTARSKKPDYEFLPEQVKQLYDLKIQAHEQIKVEQIQQQRSMEADFIPTGGALLKVEGLFVNDGLTARGQPKVRAVRIPQESLDWLQERLKVQGLQLEVLEQQQEQVRAEIAGQVVQAEQAQLAQAQEAQLLQEALGQQGLEQALSTQQVPEGLEGLI